MGFKHFFSKSKFIIIMEELTILQNKVAELKTSVETLLQKETDYQTQIAAKNAALEAANAAQAQTIADLQTQVAAGGATPAQLQTIIDSANVIKAEVDGAVVPAV